MSLDQQDLQSRHLPPWFGAGQVLVVVLTVLVHGQLLEAAPLTFVALSLIIKFVGIMSGSIRARSRASRVGNQCFVSGVCLHTSRILFRCHADWMSPESCQRKCLRPFINVTIAAVHDLSLIHISEPTRPY